jgi:serine/threonine protein kinase
MAAANPSDRHWASAPRTLVCEVLTSILSDIGAPEYLQNFLDFNIDDASILHLAEMGRLKPSVYGLPEDKCSAFIEKCREKLLAQTSSSFGAAQRGLPSRLPPLQPALDASLLSDQTEYVAAASDVSTSSQPAGDASPLSTLSSSSPVPPLASASPVDAATLLRGLNLEVLEELGKGGFGTVFRCRNRAQKLYTAVKLVNDPVNAKQARREGQKLLRAKHDYIVGMHKVHPNDDKSTWCALEMELVTGGDLSHHLEAHRRSESRLPHKAVLQFSRQLLEALVYVHDVLEWLHGDIKPQNILLHGIPLSVISAGRPLEDYSHVKIKLADFGLAKVLDQQDSTASMYLTNASSVIGTLKGTLWYLLPEAFSSSGYVRTQADDLWSACLVILEMDTGLTLQQLMHAPGSVKIVELLTKTSPELLPLLYSVLAVSDTASRCKSASELLSMLDEGEDPLFIWQLYNDVTAKYVAVDPASSVVLEKAFAANQKFTELPAPLDLQFDIEEILRLSTGLGFQTQKSSGNKCRIRRLLKAEMLNSNQSIPTWQELVDGKEWVQCSPSICAKLDVDAKNPNACIDALHYRRLMLESACIGDSQLPHPLKTEPYLVPAQDVDLKMMNKRVQDSLPEWEVTKMDQVVNSSLASKYAAYRHRVAARRNGNPNERMMFHFCNPYVIEKIWKEGEGHDPRLSNWAEVGKGAYFSNHAMYGYAYKCSLWPSPDDFVVKPELETPIGHTIQAFASLVCLGYVADMGPGCETCPSPPWDAWKKELPKLPIPTRPPVMTLPADAAEKRHILDLVQNVAPRFDSVKSTEGNFDTHPDSRNIRIVPHSTKLIVRNSTKIGVEKLGKRLRVRDFMHPRLHDGAKEWAEQYVLFDVPASYPMFILTLTKKGNSPMGPEKLLDAKYDVPYIKQLGFNASHFMEMDKVHMTVREMRIMGWSVSDCKGAGCDARSLLSGGCSVEELISAGFTPSQVEDAGADISEIEKCEVRKWFQMCALVRQSFSLSAGCNKC